MLQVPEDIINKLPLIVPTTPSSVEELDSSIEGMGLSEQGVCNLVPEKIHTICKDGEYTNYYQAFHFDFGIYILNIIINIHTYLQILVLSLNGKPEKLKAAIHAAISCFALGGR